VRLLCGQNIEFRVGAQPFFFVDERGDLRFDEGRNPGAKLCREVELWGDASRPSSVSFTFKAKNEAVSGSEFPLVR
jgi:hypothetical protein